MENKNILELRDTSISFNNVKILHDINFELRPGEVHALVGENGAGKSTMLKILSGVYKADKGEILINGIPVHINSPKEAYEAGFCIIYQELVLARNMTVYENILMGVEPKKFGIYNKKKAIELAKGYLEKVGSYIDPSSQVGELTTATQQLVEIAKALSKNTKIIAMDEPTSSLTETEIKALFKLIAELKAAGNSIIYVSHRMEEIFKIADRVTVMRDGHKIETLDIADCTKGKIINLMAGKEMNVEEGSHEDKVYDGQTPVLQIKNINTVKLKDISFDLYPNEVLGLAGLVGSGRSSVLNTLMGLYKGVEGEVIFKGQRLWLKSPAKQIGAGFGMVPEDRKQNGLFLNLDMKDNLTMIEMNHISKFGVNDKIKERELAKEYVSRLDIRPKKLEYITGSMSGGNQQKVVIGKWLAYNGLQILLLDEPTRGIDVGAKFFIHKLIRELAEKGLSIIVASSELPELLDVCDRIIVMKNGCISKELKRSEATKEKILSYAF
jgi:ABC-type sugar transport system ATPase subunit